VLLLDPERATTFSWGDPPAGFPDPESVLREVMK
jgi:hypothetical protein